MIEAADLNGLLRAVDALCEQRDWDELEHVAEMCEDALERGKQLWPIVAHIDYRLALEAPGPYAAAVLVPDSGRFALGPLTEVAASTHSWDELADHIEWPQAAAYVAQERVLRGEVLTGDERAHAEIVTLPLALEAWEPTYALAVYRSDHVEVDEPWEPKGMHVDLLATKTEPVVVPLIEDALLEIVQPWTTESNGAAKVVVVEGDARAAISALTLDKLRMVGIPSDEAIQRIAWAAASGGAHGRRRGAALGRFTAWYVLAALLGVSWPVDPSALGAASNDLEWFVWDEGTAEEGWVLRIAVEHPAQGWSAALGATDLT